jgi:uncharacterized membrane protein YgcG
MKRVFFAALAAVLGLGGAVVLSAPASAGVEDFTFDSFTADYYLDVDDQGHSTLTTVETLVARFPDFNQNQGVLRNLPEDYQGHPTDLQVESVVDENGNPRPWSAESEDGFLVMKLGEEGTYVQGVQTYVVTYTQKNVTQYFSNTDADEFYWDTNGTDWPQPFGELTARVHVPSALAANLTGSVACYRGTFGGTGTCDIQKTEESGGAVFTMHEQDIFPYENVTFSIGFEPGTFAARDDSYVAAGFPAVMQVISLVLSGIALLAAIVARATVLRDGRGRSFVIAEYQPPKGVSPLFSSVVLGKTAKGAAAQLVDFAVNKRMRIIENPDTGFFSTKTFTLQLLDARGLQGPELNLAQAVFGYGLQPGSAYTIQRQDTLLSSQVRAVLAASRAEAAQYGIFKTGTAGRIVLPILLALLGGAGGIAFGAILLDNAFGGIWPLVLLLPGIVITLIVFGLTARKPLTEKGAELRDHLDGLREYIRLAEADRLKVLQSPQGADRTPVSTDDPREVLKLNEKLLPYAVLFGLEKEWAEELSKYYVDESPDWYTGSTAFNAAIFASSIGSISASASSSMSGSSSSSGGSGGGGSSGGGGGGGGGGGF